MPLSLDQGSPESLGLLSGAVLAWLDALAADGLELHGFTLRRSGRVVAGGHWFPYGPERVHHVYSLSKAFAAVGVCLIVLRLRDPNRPRTFRAPLWWLVGAITIVGCIVFFFSLQARTQLYFLYWNALGLVIYLVWSSRNARLAKHPEKAG